MGEGEVLLEGEGKGPFACWVKRSNGFLGLRSRR